jgi:hypothetical protein
LTRCGGSDLGLPVGSYYVTDKRALLSLAIAKKCHDRNKFGNGSRPTYCTFGRLVRAPQRRESRVRSVAPKRTELIVRAIVFGARNDTLGDSPEVY